MHIYNRNHVTEQYFFPSLRGQKYPSMECKRFLFCENWCIISQNMLIIVQSTDKNPHEMHRKDEMR